MYLLGVKIKIVCNNEACRLYHVIDDETFCHSCVHFIPIDPSVLVQEIDDVKKDLEKKGQRLDWLRLEVKGRKIRKIFYGEGYGKEIS